MGYKKRELGAGLANSKAEGKETLEVAGYGGAGGSSEDGTPSTISENYVSPISG